ncbi:hypothetical protein ABBQ32_000471 [Trebouxia sp. C0010 RCD-2024]
MWRTFCVALCCLSMVHGVPGLSATALTEFLQEASQEEDWMVQIRRELHQWPELMYQEHNTSLFLRKTLDDLNIPYKFPAAKTGIVATIGKGNPVVALRTDIDALPIHEESDVPFRSRVDGKSHACGHDSHMTMLLGGAKLLKKRESELKGTVKLIFQPAEEGGAGGEKMVKEGWLKGVKAIFGFHVWPAAPTGQVLTKAGTIMGAAAQFNVTVRGRGGHAAMPHTTIDPVVAGAAVVTALQTVVARETDPLHSQVVSLTRFNTGGNAYNVIPDVVKLGATYRSLTHQGMVNMKSRLGEIIASTAKAHGCSAEIDWMEEAHPYYPPTINNPDLAAFVKGVGARVLGDDGRIQEAVPTLAGEDFSFYSHAAHVPSCFTFLGIRNEKLGTVHGLHTPKFKVDESVLRTGAAMHAALATEFLATYPSGLSESSKDEL